MNKFLLAMLSGLLVSNAAYADNKKSIVEGNSLKFLAAAKITPEASARFLKNSAFTFDKDTFGEDATIIHNRLHADDEPGRPFLFAFNEGSRVVGVAGAYDNSNKAFFDKLSKTDNVTCSKQKSRFYVLMTCYNKSAKSETVRKFQKDFKYLMENAG